MSKSIFKAFQTDADVKELKKVEAEHKKRLNEINKKEKEDTKRIEKEAKKHLKNHDMSLDADKNKAEQEYKKVERETTAEMDKLIAAEKEDVEKIKANLAANETDKAQRAAIIQNDTQRKIDRANEKLAAANKAVADAYARIKAEENKYGSPVKEIEDVKNRAAFQRQAADKVALEKAAELQNKINLKKENITDLEALNEQNKNQLKEVHDLLDFFLANSKNPTNTKPIADACNHIHKEALKLARSAAEEKDMQSLQDSLGSLRESLQAAKKVVEHPEVESHITNLKAVAKTAAGKSNLWKKLGGALTMLVSAAMTFTLGLLGAPATGGTSAVAGSVVSGVMGATGLGLLFSGRQKGYSKSLSTLAKVAEQENRIEEVVDSGSSVPVPAPKKPSQDNPMVDVANLEEVAAPKLRF